MKPHIITVETPDGLFNVFYESREYQCHILPFNVSRSVATAISFQLNLEWERLNTTPF